MKFACPLWILNICHVPSHLKTTITVNELAHHQPHQSNARRANAGPRSPAPLRAEIHRKVMSACVALEPALVHLTALPLCFFFLQNTFSSPLNWLWIHYSASGEPEMRSPRAKLLWDKWRHVWLLSWDRQKRLHDHLMYLQELERVRQFSWDDWRKRVSARATKFSPTARPSSKWDKKRISD